MALVSQQNQDNLLRRAIQVDSLVSAVSGLVLMAGAGPLAGFLGVGAPTALVATGILFLLYALTLWQISAREPVNPRLAYVPLTLNALYVIGSVLLLVSGWLPLTAAGYWTIGVAAAIVAILAEVQYYGLRRAR